MNPKDFDRWMTTLSDEARADVMKTAIKETETTKRAVVGDSAYQEWRTYRIFWPTLAIVVLSGMFGAHACYVEDTTRLRLQAEHPAAFPPDAGK